MEPVSVIIPTFNRADVLEKALESVMRQRNADLEVIVVDDGSTDDTLSRVVERFPTVKYVYQENSGPAAARNRGIRLATSRWIAFLDSDDQWLEDKIRIQLGYLDKHPGMRICQTEEIWIRDGVRVNPMNKHRKWGGWIYEKCLPLCLISPSAVMIERKLLMETGLFDESFPACEDYELWLRITSRFPVGLIETPCVIRHGGHEDQLSRRYPAMDRFRIQALVKILASGTLTHAQKEKTLAMLEEKTRIYAQGAVKRGRKKEAKRLRSVIDGLSAKKPGG